MYVLRKEKVLTILSGLVEGHSIRALERMTGVNQNTIMSWLVRSSEVCQHVLDEKIQGITTKYVQADELWSFIGKKANSSEYAGEVMNGHTLAVAMKARNKRRLGLAVTFNEMLKPN